MEKTKNLDERIGDILAEGPLAALYLVAGITALKEKLDSLDDEQIYKEFAGLLAPERVRANVDYLFRKLNNIKPDKK